MYKDYVLIVPRLKLWRAKQLALEKLHGSYLIQYLKIEIYADEIGSTNQRSSLLCKLDGVLFQKMYVFLKACAVEVQHGRPLISLDGSF